MVHRPHHQVSLYQSKQHYTNPYHIVESSMELSYVFTRVNMSHLARKALFGLVDSVSGDSTGLSLCVCHGMPAQANCKAPLQLHVTLHCGGACVLSCVGSFVLSFLKWMCV